MGEGTGGLIPRLQGGGGGGCLFDILAIGVVVYPSVGAYSRKYGNAEILNRYNCNVISIKVENCSNNE